jgi:acyl-CoA thioester hydrolase
VRRLTIEPSTDPTSYSFVHPIRVRFAETDAMGIAHHSSYLLYLEEARVAYMRAIGQSYDEVNKRDLVHFAVLEAAIEYRRALRFDDVVDVHTLVADVTRATLQVAYLLRCGNDLVATAVTVHGCVDGEGRATRMPAWVTAGI